MRLSQNEVDIHQNYAGVKKAMWSCMGSPKALTFAVIGGALYGWIKTGKRVTPKTGQPPAQAQAQDKLPKVSLRDIFKMFFFPLLPLIYRRWITGISNRFMHERPLPSSRRF